MTFEATDFIVIFGQLGGAWFAGFCTGHLFLFVKKIVEQI